MTTAKKPVDPKRSAAAKKAAATRAAKKAGTYKAPASKPKKVTAKKLKAVTRASGLQEMQFEVDGPKGTRVYWIRTRAPYQKGKYGQRIVPVVDYTAAEARAEAIERYIKERLHY